MRTDVVERVRITFGVEWPLCYASVLDQGRLWERLLRRGKIPIPYTQGYSPHPRLTFAAALPVGYTSECEILDLLLAEKTHPKVVADVARSQSPDGLRILSAEEVPLKEPPLQSNMREAYYVVTLTGRFTRTQIAKALDDFLARDTVPRQRTRKGRLRDYDLRPLVHDLSLVKNTERKTVIRMRVACGPNGSGRPEEIVEELDVPVVQCTIRRTRLIWQDRTPEPEEGL